jgi:hypothetical protein
MTPEGETPSAAPRRFVVLLHADRAGEHYDLMIEAGERLATWKCPSPPEQTGPAGRTCERLTDHRRLYLDYEGPISGDRGTVRRHDCGTCVVLDQTAGHWLIDFSGLRLRGRYELVLQPDQPQSWGLRLSG